MQTPKLTPKDFVTHVITMLYGEPFNMHTPEEYQVILQDLASYVGAEKQTVYHQWEDDS